MDADSSYGGSDTAHDLHSAHDDSTHHIGSSSPPHPGSTHLEHTSHPSDSAHPPSVPQSTHEVTLNVCYDDDDEDDSVMDSNKAEYLAATKIGVGNGEEPHSNLEETSRNFRSTNRLNESPPPEKGRRYSAGGGGVENPAFVGDVKSTFNHEKPYNGDLNNSTLGVCSLNKSEEPMTEAVNLELINMKPVGTNGTDQYDVGNGLTTIPLKKENNRDIGNPYDEYFVPVNEHRKYMRGEKLYVTKDKRGEKSKSKCFCWAVCLCVVALALIVGILAAVGVIGGEKSKPQEVARKLDNPEQPIVKGGLSIPGGSEGKNPPPFTPEPPISTVSPMLPTTDLTGIIVPRVLESQIIIDNLQYTPDLAQKNSSEYQALAQSLEDMIKSTLFPKDMLQYGPADIEVKVMEFSPGSVVVKYRIGWKFKQGIHSPRDPIDENILKKRMTAALEKNNGLMDRFHVLEDSVKTEKILDLCKIQNNDCEDVCVFDYHNLNFACLCPDGKHLDLDGKRCVEHDHGYLEHAHVHQHHPEPSAEPEPGHEHEPSAEPEPEPSAGHEHEPSAEPEPEPSAGHELEPSAEPEPEPSAGHEHEPSAEPEPEPSAGHEPEPSAEPEPGPSAGHEHEPSAEPEPEPSAGHEHEHSDEESSSSAEREPKSQFEPDMKELTVEPVGAKPEPSAEPEPAASPKPTELLVEPIEGNTSVTHQPYSEPSTTISNHLVHHQDESRAFHDHVIFAEPEMITVSPITEKVSVNTSAENKEPNNNTTEAHMVTSTTESLKYVLNDLLIEHHDLHQIVESTTAQPEPVEDDFVTTEEPFDLHAVHQEIHPDDFYYGNIIPIKEESKTVIETTTVMNEESTTMIPEKLNNETTTGRNDMEVEVPISNETNVITSTTEKLEEIVPTTMVVIGTTEKFNETKVVSVNATNVLSTAGDFNETKDVEAITSTTEKQNATMEKMTLLPEIQNDTMTTTTSKSNSIGPNIVLPEAEVITTTISPEEDTTDSTSEELNTTATTTLEADMTTVTPSSIEENEVTHPLIIPVVIRESPDYYEFREVMAMTTIKPRENVTESQEFSRISETPSGSHENLTLYQPEHMHDEYMSPFLPDLENDTFINSLHSEEHFLLDHKEESHENASVTKPPSLEFDQLNHTNPFDNHTSDASLGIVPLRPEEENNVTPATTVSSKENVLLNGVPNTTESQTSEITSTEAVRTEILPTNATGITTEASLPPEIINNVHSNPIFEKHFSKFIATDGAAQTTTKIPETTTLHHNEATTETPEVTTIETIPEITTIQMSETSTTKVPEIGANTTVSNEINSQASTEDLIAMETTTKKVSNETRVASLPVVDETKTDALDTTTNTILNETKVENLPAVETTTMPDNDTRKEILSISDITNETSNTTAHTISNNISSMSSEALETSTKTASNEISPASAEDLLALETTTSNEKLERKEATTIHAEILETAKTDVKVISEDENDITGSSTPEPVLYRVRELVSDITTTEKLFVSRKTTTESSEDLSVEPLVGKEELTFNDRPSSEHFNDLIDEQIKKGTLEDDKLTMESKCSIGEFQCVNGTSVRDGKYCVSNSDKCDSVLDCTDGSDEEGCEKEGCLTNFQCASGQCLKRHLVCDGILNCNDGSDEMNCDTWSCNTDELSCGTAQRCIPTSWKCDGKAHCQDGSDERACQFNECHADSFHCKSQGRCIPMSWKCDGRSDCADGEDEQSCDCNQEEFKCSLGGGCVPKSSRCDGTEQCPDRSDEWNCLRLGNGTTEKKTLQWRSQDGTWHPVCMDWVVWNTTYADRACRKMGYTGSSSLESVPRSEGIESREVYDLDGSTGGLRFRKREGDCEQFASITCQEHSCRGSSNLDISSARIVGGNKASITQWPSLGILHNEKSNVYCTATLLTPLWAIAGYSCVVANSNAENAENWDLYVGSTNKYDNSSGQARKVQEIIRHPQVKFSEFEFVNDVVLVQLQRPVTINLNVSSICLPEKDIEPRQLCIVAGWGVNMPGEPDMQQYLHYLPVPMIDSSECNSTKYYNGKLDSDKICAGSTGSEKTPCYNDEGAPLMCYSDPSASWELRGLLSHHGNCGAGKQPAVYTALSRDLRSWIKDTIGRQAFEDEQ